MDDGVPILRPGEAAELLGVHLSRLRRLEASGRLVTVRTLGGHRRYRQDDVLALRRWLDRRQKVAAA
ncbi:MAG TPA: helix-turn-helix domain-containing protein [Acidimicrobiia bacterium]|nr:helix-turn-helix domain-containing protein [Acidimicrobiia bacterium]